MQRIGWDICIGPWQLLHISPVLYHSGGVMRSSMKIFRNLVRRTSTTVLSAFMRRNVYLDFKESCQSVVYLFMPQVRHALLARCTMTLVHRGIESRMTTTAYYLTCIRAPSSAPLLLLFIILGQLQYARPVSGIFGHVPVCREKRAEEETPRTAGED